MEIRVHIQVMLLLSFLKLLRLFIAILLLLELFMFIKQLTLTKSAYRVGSRLFWPCQIEHGAHCQD